MRLLIVLSLHYYYYIVTTIMIIVISVIVIRCVYEVGCAVVAGVPVCAAISEEYTYEVKRNKRNKYEQCRSNKYNITYTN